MVHLAIESSDLFTAAFCIDDAIDYPFLEGQVIVQNENVHDRLQYRIAIIQA